MSRDRRYKPGKRKDQGPKARKICCVWGRFSAPRGPRETPNAYKLLRHRTDQEMSRCYFLKNFHKKEKERTKGRRPEKYAASGGALAPPEVPERPRTLINYITA